MHVRGRVRGARQPPQIRLNLPTVKNCTGVHIGKTRKTHRGGAGEGRGEAGGLPVGRIPEEVPYIVVSQKTPCWGGQNGPLYSGFTETSSLRTTNFAIFRDFSRFFRNFRKFLKIFAKFCALFSKFRKFRKIEKFDFFHVFAEGEQNFAFLPGPENFWLEPDSKMVNLDAVFLDEKIFTFFQNRWAPERKWIFRVQKVFKNFSKFFRKNAIFWSFLDPKNSGPDFSSKLKIDPPAQNAFFQKKWQKLFHKLRSGLRISTL